MAGGQQGTDLLGVSTRLWPGPPGCRGPGHLTWKPCRPVTGGKHSGSWNGRPSVDLWPEHRAGTGMEGWRLPVLPALRTPRPSIRTGLPSAVQLPGGLALTPPNSCHHPWGGRACWGHCPLLTTSRTRSPLRLCHPLRPRHDQNPHRASPRPPRPGALAPRNASPCSLCPWFSLVVILTDGEPAQPPAPPASGPLPVTRGPAPSGAGTGFVGPVCGVRDGGGASSRPRGGQSLRPPCPVFPPIPPDCPCLALLPASGCGHCPPAWLSPPRPAA